METEVHEDESVIPGALNDRVQTQHFTVVDVQSNELDEEKVQEKLAESIDLRNKKKTSKLEKLRVPDLPNQHEKEDIVLDINDDLYNSEDNNEDLVAESCGLFPKSTIELIVKGTLSNKKSFPWLTGILYRGQFICAGNLITATHILTG